MTLNRTIYEIQHEGKNYRIVSYRNHLMQLYKYKRQRKTEKYKWKFILAYSGQPVPSPETAMVILERIYATRNI